MHAYQRVGALNLSRDRSEQKRRALCDAVWVGGTPMLSRAGVHVSERDVRDPLTTVASRILCDDAAARPAIVLYERKFVDRLPVCFERTDFVLMEPCLPTANVRHRSSLPAAAGS
jgi:hypothetical protein